MYGIWVEASSSTVQICPSANFPYKVSQGGAAWANLPTGTIWEGYCHGMLHYILFWRNRSFNPSIYYPRVCMRDSSRWERGRRGYAWHVLVVVYEISVYVYRSWYGCYSPSFYRFKECMIRPKFLSRANTSPVRDVLPGGWWSGDVGTV